MKEKFEPALCEVVVLEKDNDIITTSGNPGYGCPSGNTGNNNHNPWWPWRWPWHW